MKVNGTLYFRTKGDGNSYIKWPDTPSPSEYDPWETNGVPGIREDLVVGKVVMRIPWLGHIALFMRNSVGLLIVIALVIILVIVEFIVPLLREKSHLNNRKKHNSKHKCIYKNSILLTISPATTISFFLFGGS